MSLDLGMRLRQLAPYNKGFHLFPISIRDRTLERTKMVSGLELNFEVDLFEIDLQKAEQLFQAKLPERGE